MRTAVFGLFTICIVFWTLLINHAITETRQEIHAAKWIEENCTLIGNSLMVESGGRIIYLTEPSGGNLTFTTHPVYHCDVKGD